MLRLVSLDSTHMLPLIGKAHSHHPSKEHDALAFQTILLIQARQMYNGWTMENKPCLIMQFLSSHALVGMVCVSVSLASASFARNAGL